MHEPVRCAPGSSRVTVIGLHGGQAYGVQAMTAMSAAAVLVGSARHLAEVVNDGAERRLISGPLTALLDAIETDAETGRSVCVLASGDPGFFGIVRALAGRLGRQRLVIYPAPSSVALAAAKLGIPWDDLTVVSAHGRDLDAAVNEIVRAERVAVLTAPATPPEAIGRALLKAGATFEHVAVCSYLGSSGEQIVRTTLAGLADGSFDGLSVVVLERDRPTLAPTLRWGRTTSVFDHRAGMITKPEVRIVALARLDLPTSGVFWDVGAGSGSIAVEAAALAPALQVLAVEQRQADADRIQANAATLDVAVRVVIGSAPGVLEQLPDPDRVFVGGGGIDVLDAVLRRLRPGGLVVATYAAMDRALHAHARLGNLTQISVSNASTLPGGGGVRLAADNPVFLAWGTPS